MRNYLVENFNRYYDRLNEEVLNETRPFDRNNLNPSQVSFFKFLTSPNDLISVLKSSIIWSAFYNEKSGQYDAYCKQLENETGKEWEYVCLTSEPLKVALEYKRPFGIEFDKDGLLNYINNKEYKFRAFNQFQAKTNVREEQAIKNMTYSLRIGTVGKYKDGKCFYTLQGGYEPRIIDNKVYNSLVSWVKNNTAKHQLIHFINNKNDNALKVKQKGQYEVSTDKYVYTVGDFVAEDSLDSFEVEEYSEGKVHYICKNKCFQALDTGAGFQFNRNFNDIYEIYTSVLNKSVGLQAASPGKYGKLINNNYIPPIVNPALNNDSKHIMPKDVYQELDQTLNEYEFRIYLPKGNDFKFDKTIIKEIKLPKIYSVTKGKTSPLIKYIHLKQLFDLFEKDEFKTDESLLNICNSFNINYELLTKVIIRLFNVLKTNHYNIEFFDYEDDIKNSLHGKNINMEFTSEDPYQTVQVDKRDFQRYITNASTLNKVFNLDLGDKTNLNDDNTKLVKLYDANNNPSILYKDFSPNGSINKTACARLGAEGIIMSKDSEDNWYLLLVKKGDNFNELPGGSFNDKPNSENDLKRLAINKIKEETDIKLNQSDIKLLDKIIYQYEGKMSYTTSKKGLNLPQDSIWNYPYAVYWLVVGVLDQEIDISKKYYNGDGMSRWFLIESLKHDESFLERYYNIIPIIDQYINQ